MSKDIMMGAHCPFCGNIIGDNTWIPVSERLPDTVDIFIVTFLWDKIKEVTVTTSSYFKSRGWAIEKDNSGLSQGEVIAWRPKPKPYNPNP